MEKYDLSYLSEDDKKEYKKWKHRKIIFLIFAILSALAGFIIFVFMNAYGLVLFVPAFLCFVGWKKSSEEKERVIEEYVDYF